MVGDRRNDAVDANAGIVFAAVVEYGARLESSIGVRGGGSHDYSLPAIVGYTRTAADYSAATDDTSATNDYRALAHSTFACG